MDEIDTQTEIDGLEHRLVGRIWKEGKAASVDPAKVTASANLAALWEKRRVAYRALYECDDPREIQPLKNAYFDAIAE